MPVPEVTVETVRRPVSFETWTSTPEPLPYIPRITTTQANPNPLECVTITAPCTCAGVSECEWVKINDEGRCQLGSGRVPCSACDAQQECQALTCGGLKSACLCAFSPLKCHWDSASGTCFEGVGTTRCSACARQSRCNPPQIVSFVPAAGVQLTLPAHQYLQIDFDKTVTIKTGTIAFICSGQALPFYPKSDHIQESPSRTGMRISIQTLLDARFKTVRECTLEMGYGVVVDNADVPFTGLDRDLYTFKLGDTTQPRLLSYEPTNGQTDVSAGSPVTFFFDEDIQLLSGSQVIVIYEGGDGSSGLSYVAVAEFQLSSPTVSIASREISVDLSRLTKPNLYYSLDLPNNAISDIAGNVFPGIEVGYYTFRTRNTFVIEQSGGVSGIEENFPLILAGGSGLLVALGILITWRLCQLKKHPSARRISPETIPSPEGLPQVFNEDLDGTGTTWGSFDPSETDNSSRNWAQKVKPSDSPKAKWSRSSTTHSVKLEAGTKPATPSGRPTLGEFQDKTFSKRSNTSYSNLGSGTRENPQATNHTNQSRASGQSSQSRPQSRPTSQPASKTVSEDEFSGDSEEVKAKKQAVKKILLDLMNKPFAERKKAFREMVLQYHPDKSSDEHAKEVFQYINASKAWFLEET